MRRILMALFAYLVICMGIVGWSDGRQHRSDDFLRQRVVKLFSSQGSCSGIKVKAASGKTYVLTAKHCLPLVQPKSIDPMTGQPIGYDMIEASDDNGRPFGLHFIAVSETEDLMILTSDTQDGVSVANSVRFHQHVHAITHGLGLPAYRTDGELLGQSILTVGWIPAHYYEMSSCSTVPGSSGGGLLDDNNDLVGILTGGNPTVSLWTPLSDIKRFLADY